MTGLVVTRSETTPSRPGKAARPVWVVDGPDLEAYASALYALGGKRWRGTFSFWSDPTAAIAGLGEQDREGFAERQAGARVRAAARAERLGESAARHAAAAEAAGGRAERMASMMSGEPIKVGHHSERRHRRDLDRMDGLMRRAVDETAESREYARRASASAARAEDAPTPAFVARRIADAERGIRDVDRKLARPDCTGEWRYRLETFRAGYVERADYWRARQAEQHAEGGAVAYGPETVRPGDLVLIRGRWEVVVRANPKTVSALSQYLPFPLKYPYAEVQAHRPKAATAAATEGDG